MNEKNIAEKMPYPLTDTEEAVNLATAKILSDRYRMQADAAVGKSVIRDMEESKHVGDHSLEFNIVENKDVYEVNEGVYIKDDKIDTMPLSISAEEVNKRNPSSSGPNIGQR